MNRKPNRARTNGQPDWTKQLQWDYEFAKRLFFQRGSLPTFFIIHGAERNMVIHASARDDEEKAIFTTYVRHVAIAEAATAVTYITEAWTVERELLPGETVEDVLRRNDRNPARLAPDRKEIIYVQCEWRDEQNQLQRQAKRGEIQRDDAGKPLRVEEVPLPPGDMMGRATELVPPNPIPENARAYARMVLDRAKSAGIHTETEIWRPGSIH